MEYPETDGISTQDTQFEPERPVELLPGYREEGLLVQCAHLAIGFDDRTPDGNFYVPDTVFAMPVSLRTRPSRPYETARVEVTLENY